MMLALLQMEGFAPRAASNGRDALAQLHHGPAPHVIVLDLMMPVMDGWTFLRVKSSEPRLAGIPVIIASAIATEHLANLQAVAVVPKPFDVEQLVAAIKAYC